MKIISAALLSLLCYGPLNLAASADKDAHLVHMRGSVQNVKGHASEQTPYLRADARHLETVEVMSISETVHTGAKSKSSKSESKPKESKSSKPNDDESKGSKQKEDNQDGDAKSRKSKSSKPDDDESKGSKQKEDNQDGNTKENDAQSKTSTSKASKRAKSGCSNSPPTCSQDLCTVSTSKCVNGQWRCEESPKICQDGYSCDALDGICKKVEATTDMEMILQDTFADEPNSEVLSVALKTGLIPESLMDDMEEGSKCGLVTGIPTISSTLSVPEGENFLTIKGTFNCTDGTPIEDIVVKIYDVDSSHGSSKLSGDEGAFEIILADPLPGFSPHFLMFTEDCDARKLEHQQRRSLTSDGNNGISLLYVTNLNIVNDHQLTATLTWDEEFSDVDLHIFEPEGDHVYYGNQNGTAGALDRDDTDGFGPEHYFSDYSEEGVYQLYVNLYARHNNETVSDIPWTLSFKIGSSIVDVKTGVFTDESVENDNDTISLMFGPYEIDVSEYTSNERRNPFEFLGLMEIAAPMEKAPEEQNYEEIAPPDWYPIDGPGFSSNVWFLYELQKNRDLVYHTNDHDREWERKYEVILNDGWLSWWYDDGEKYLLTDVELTAVRDDCEDIEDELEKAICAGKKTYSLYQENNEDGVCRHYAVGHAHALRELGIQSKIIYSYLEGEYAHLYLTLRIGDRIYIMDAYNRIYIQYGINDDQFNLVYARWSSPVTVTSKSTGTHNALLEFQLTAAQNWDKGAVWGKRPIDTRKSFHLNFEAYFGNNNEGGDGIMFVLQRMGPWAIGQTGGHYLAYDGISPSFGVEFDTWYYDPDVEDRNEIPWDHITIVKNGMINSPIVNPVAATFSGEPIDDGSWHDISIQYDVSSGIIKIFFDGKLRLSHNVGRTLTFHKVYWGFTSATGNKNNKQLIRLEKTIQYGLPGDNEWSRYNLEWDDMWRSD